MYTRLLLFFCICTKAFAQNDTTPLNPGDKARGFNLILKDNITKPIAFPYQKRIVLLHFWGNDNRSKGANAQLRSIAERYRNAMYKNCDGFEVITVAVKMDKMLWKEALWTDSMGVFVNGIAKDLKEDVCKKYSVTGTPHDVLIDEKGVVMMFDPKPKDLEALLAERKVFQPVKRDMMGMVAQAVNKDEVLKNTKLQLYTAYGDTIASCVSSPNGRFMFNNIKLNQDLVLKVVKSDFDATDAIALYAMNGDFLTSGVIADGVCTFHIPYKMAYHLLDVNVALLPKEQMNLVNNLEFTSTGTFQLSPKDEEELENITQILQKNKQLAVEFKTHTDTKSNDAAAMDVTTRQVQLIKNYFQKKGIAASRIKGIPKGRSAPAKPCASGKCSEEDNRQNRRVEFVIS